MKQLELFSVEKSTSDVSYLDDDLCTDSLTDLKYHYSVVSESKCTTEKLVSESSGTINTYCAAGKARGHNQYFRYSWRDGNRVRHRHIPGGNIDSLTAQKRVAMILLEIGVGRSPEYILEMIKSF